MVVPKMLKRNTKRTKLIKEKLRLYLPHAPLSDFTEIESKAASGHLRHLPPSIAAKLAISSYVRHVHTDYDQLLSEGYDADSARFFVLGDLNAMLRTWGSPLEIGAEDE